MRRAVGVPKEERWDSRSQMPRGAGGVAFGGLASSICGLSGSALGLFADLHQPEAPADGWEPGTEAAALHGSQRSFPRPLRCHPTPPFSPLQVLTIVTSALLLLYFFFGIQLMVQYNLAWSWVISGAFLGVSLLQLLHAARDDAGSLQKGLQLIRSYLLVLFLVVQVRRGSGYGRPPAGLLRGVAGGRRQGSGRKEEDGTLSHLMKYVATS